MVPRGNRLRYALAARVAQADRASIAVRIRARRSGRFGRMLAQPPVAHVDGAGISVIRAGCRAETGDAQTGGALPIDRAGLHTLRVHDAGSAAIALVRQGVALSDGARCALWLFRIGRASAAAQCTILRRVALTRRGAANLLDRDSATGVATRPGGAVHRAIVAFLIRIDSAISAETQIAKPDNA